MNNRNVPTSTKEQQDGSKKHISFASSTFPQFSVGSYPDTNDRCHKLIQTNCKAMPHRPPFDSFKVATLPPSPSEPSPSEPKPPEPKPPEPKPSKAVDILGCRESPVVQKLPFQLFGQEKIISIGGQENVPSSNVTLKSGKCSDCPCPVFAGLERCLDCKTSPFGSGKSSGSFTFSKRASALGDAPMYKPLNEDGCNKRVRVECAPKVVPKGTFPDSPVSLKGKGSFIAWTSASKTNKVVVPEKPPSTPRFFGIVGTKLASSSTSSSASK